MQRRSVQYVQENHFPFTTTSGNLEKDMVSANCLQNNLHLHMLTSLRKNCCLNILTILKKGTGSPHIPHQEYWKSPGFFSARLARRFCVIFKAKTIFAKTIPTEYSRNLEKDIVWHFPVFEMVYL